MSKPAKKFWEMNKSELAEATKEFDTEFVADKARPVTRKERLVDQRARRRGRPPVGLGSQKIHITLERGLVKKADKIAQQNGWGHSELIARALATEIGRKTS